MTSNAKQSKTCKTHSMVFPIRKVFYLLDKFDETSQPRFEINFGEFCDESKPNKKFCSDEDAYVKVLYELNRIAYKLDKLGPFYIKQTKGSSFTEAFPNIMRLFYEREKVFGC